MIVSVEGVRERSEVLGDKVSPLAPDSIGRRDRVGRPLHRVPGAHQALEQIGRRPSRRAPVLEALSQLRRGPVVRAQVSVDVVGGHRRGSAERSTTPSEDVPADLLQIRAHVSILAQHHDTCHLPSQGSRAAVSDQSPAQTTKPSRLKPKSPLTLAKGAPLSLRIASGSPARSKSRSKLCRTLSVPAPSMARNSNT